MDRIGTLIVDLLNSVVRVFHTASVREDKQAAQDLLFGLLLKEPNLGELLEISPSRDKNIREEAYDFLEELIEDLEPCAECGSRERVHRRHLLKSRLEDLIKELETHGTGSPTYREFHRYVEGG